MCLIRYNKSWKQYWKSYTNVLQIQDQQIRFTFLGLRDDNLQHKQASNIVQEICQVYRLHSNKKPLSFRYLQNMRCQYKLSNQQ